MQIGTTTVTTPFDCPMQFDPDWRNRVAAALFETPNMKIPEQFRPIRKDPWIQGQVRYLTVVKHKGRITKELEPYRMASAVSQGSRPSDVRFKLEALLLTAAGFDIVEKDLEGSDECAVPTAFYPTYERLYFSCRRKDGSPAKGCQLRMYFALPDSSQLDEYSPVEQLWKTIGATLGYRALVAMWLWPDAHGLQSTNQKFFIEDLWNMSQALQLDRIARRQISNFDLNNTAKVAADTFQMEHNLAPAGSSESQNKRALIGLLSHFAPNIISCAKTVDEQPDVTRAIAQRITSQKAISGQEVLDLGRDIGYDGLTKKIQQEIRSKPRE